MRVPRFGKTEYALVTSTSVASADPRATDR